MRLHAGTWRILVWAVCSLPPGVVNAQAPEPSEPAASTDETSAGEAASADAAKAECARAYEQTQRQRRSGKLQAALEQAVACAQTRCPLVLRGDCTSWARELETSIPSVVIEARDSRGLPLHGVAVTVDGVRLSGSTDGRAFRVDPGPHGFRYETPDGRVVDRTELIVEGEKNQRLVVDFAAPAAATPNAGGGANVSPFVYAFGATSVLGLAGFTYFGLKGNARKDELEECEPRCSKSKVDTTRRDYLIADVSLGVAALSVGALIWVIASGDSDPPAKTARAPLGRLDFEPRPDGAIMGFRRVF